MVMQIPVEQSSEGMTRNLVVDSLDTGPVSSHLHLPLVLLAEL